MLEKKKGNAWFPYVLIIPGVLILFLVKFLPFFQNVFYSFTDFSLLNKDQSLAGIHHYIDIYFGREFFPSLRITLIWAVFNIALMMLIGLIAAFVMNSSSIKGVVILEVFLLIPWVLPEVVTGYVWRLLLNYQTGPYYKVLEFLGIIAHGEDIFSNDTYAMAAVVMANVWRSFPIVAITVFAKLKTLAKDQIEAAVIDGAKRRVIFFSIELPHVAATMASVLTLCFVWTFNAFGIIRVMTGGGPAGATEVLSIRLQRIAFEFYDYSYSSAFSVMMILVLIGIVLMANFAPSMVKKAFSRKRLSERSEV